MTKQSTDENTTAQTKLIPKRDGGVQPRKQANKARAVVKMRREEIIKGVLAGKTHQECGIAAGFSQKTAAQQVSQTLRNPIVQNALVAAMEKLGMDDEYLALHHKLLIEGKKHIPARGSDNETGLYIEIPDNQARAKGLDLAYRLMGKYSDRAEVELKQPVTVVIRKFCSRTIAKDSVANGDSTAI
jgi:hypothetical protein